MEYKELIRELGPVAYLLLWLDKHPLLEKLLLLIETIAIMWMVISYDFTTSC